MNDQQQSKSVLGDFYLKEYSNISMPESGLDDIRFCIDPEHFKQYPHPIDYQYNSRGFRDQEWPDSLQELKDAVWVVGDSFTSGLGSPLAHTWPAVLAKNINHRVINVSLDGASNDWISRRARAIVDHIAPRAVIVMWSYLHRTESDQLHLSDCDRRQHFISMDSWDHLTNFEKCVELLKDTGVYWCCIPEHYHSRDDQRAKYHSIVRHLGPPVVEEIKKLDLARDGHHFDIKTSEWLVPHVLAAIAPALDPWPVVNCPR